MKTILFIFCILLVSLGFSQKYNSNSNANSYDNNTKSYKEVVITGQLSPQSVNESVFEVNVIDQDDIERQAGNTLADVLNHTLNLTILPNSSSGKSKVQMLGLDGQYFKILVDNVPLLNEEGLGNNSDLTKINLDDIKRIEIVEGAMGVQYGANAIAGVINIITKKGRGVKSWKITPYIQEETIGNEYNFNNMGRHIQSLTIGKRWNNQFFTNVTVNHNQFNGYFNGRKGEHYSKSDDRRGYDWLPKRSWDAKALMYYSSDHFKLYYKFEYYNEILHQYSPTVFQNYNAATLTRNPTANDKTFLTQRYYNTLNFIGDIKNKLNYNISVSYQIQKKDVETYTYFIKEHRMDNVEMHPFESRKGFYSRGTFNNFIQSTQFDLQLGYELSSINGFASPMSGAFLSESIERRLGSYDAFIAAEYKPLKNLAFQPGARLMIAPMFGMLPVFSLSSRYKFKNNTQLRLILGSSSRTPNYDELYTHFVDVNHNVTGNENLIPERGYSVFIHGKRHFYINKDHSFHWYPKLSAWYMNVQNRIDLVITDVKPLKYRYENINNFQSVGFSFRNKFNYKHLYFNVGGTYSGISKIMEGSQRELPSDFLFAWQFNGSISYSFPKTGLVLSAYYKYTGPQYQFIQTGELTTDGNENSYVKGKQSAFQWMDVSVKKTFFQDLELTVGVRNLFDVTRINTTTVGGGIHAAGNSTVLLGYGRSYFIKLLYHIKF